MPAGKRFVSSRLVRRLLWRTAAFTLVAFLLLALAELWVELRSERADVHQRALRAAELAHPSIERAVWTYDELNLRLASESLLRDAAVSAVSVETAEPALRLHLGPNSEPGAALSSAWSLPGTAPVWSRALYAPGSTTEVIGRLVVAESFHQVDSDALLRAAYRLPSELLKVLAIVVGLTVLTHGQVVARVNALARQMRQMSADGQSGQARVVDIGARKYGDDEIRELADALDGYLREREAARQAELAQERAEAASEAKSELLSRISHELRTPLNAIVGFAQVLQKDPVVAKDAERAHRVGLIHKAGQLLTRLISDLLDYSRIEQGAERIECEAVSVPQAGRRALALVSADAAEAGVELVGPLGDQTAVASADPVRLEQVLLNLLSNAIKYNRRGGRVELRVGFPQNTEGAGSVTIEVADNGLGMTQEQLAALYQPFNRLGREASGRPGTGIGLVITRRLVERMQGDLRVTSQEGHGTVFTVSLPRAVPGENGVDRRVGAGREAPVPHQGDPGTRAQPAGPTPTAPARVLYVEDDEVNVELMRAVFSARPHWTLLLASTLAQARDVLQAQQPDLMLLDMHLPDGDGTELLRQWRARPARWAMPVLVVSADAEEHGLSRAQAAGADGYVAKPIDIHALLQRIDALLAGRSAAPVQG